MSMWFDVHDSLARIHHEKPESTAFDHTSPQGLGRPNSVVPIKVQFVAESQRNE